MGENYDLHDKIIENERKVYLGEEDDEIHKRVSNRYEAMIFQMMLDRSSYESVWVALRIHISQGDDKYQHNMYSARNILYNYSIPNIIMNNIQKKYLR